MPPKTPAPKSNRVRNLVLTVIGIAVAGWLIHFSLHAYRYEVTDDAAVAGHVHQISPELNGRVKAVKAAENQDVQAGQPLVELDAAEFEVALQRAKAALAQSAAGEARARSNVARSQANIAQAKARIGQAEAQGTQARAQASLAKLTLERDRKLLGQGADGAVTPADVDAAQSAHDAADAAVLAAEANAEAAKAAVGFEQAEASAAEADVTAAAAASAAAKTGIADAERVLGDATIRAPADGRIGNKAVEPGNRVQAGQTLMALVEPAVWVVANFKETQLARIRPGQEVEITIDSVPGHALRGKVDSVAPASGAQFALLPPDNATGNFTKVVQRVPVRILFDPDAIRGIEDRVRPGLSANVDVRVR